MAKKAPKPKHPTPDWLKSAPLPVENLKPQAAAPAKELRVLCPWCQKPMEKRPSNPFLQTWRCLKCPTGGGDVSLCLTRTDVFGGSVGGQNTPAR